MSDFFSGVHGAKFPEVVMNSGPLPPANGLPAPLHDTADARINYNSTLLGNLDPYAYGEPGFLSSQISYVNQPHRIQKIIPPLRLPTPQVNTESSFEISHAVDDSDIAFSLRLDRGSTICSMMSAKGGSRARVSTSLDAFINLPTLNYLLAGLQLCYIPHYTVKSKWFDLLHDLDKSRYETVGTPLGLFDLRYIVRDLVRPFGVVRGSEKQGGQDETGLGAATWPVNFVANLVLDGKERNVVNVWHYHDISAGDDLVLRLKPMPIPAVYTLNHYYKRYIQQDFASYLQHDLLHARATHVWQLVPDIFDLDSEPENDKTHAKRMEGSKKSEMEEKITMSPGFDVPEDYVWQEHGFWHIGRSQVMSRKYAQCEYYNDDMANMLKVNHMDMTFEPTWTKVPGEERDPASHRSVVSRFDPDTYAASGRMDFQGVKPGMMGSEYSGGRVEKRMRWAPELQLETFINAAMPMPSYDGNPAAEGGRLACDPLASLFSSAGAANSQRSSGCVDPLAGLFGPTAQQRRPLPVLRAAPPAEIMMMEIDSSLIAEPGSSAPAEPAEPAEAAEPAEPAEAAEPAAAAPPAARFGALFGSGGGKGRGGKKKAASAGEGEPP